MTERPTLTLDTHRAPSMHLSKATVDSLSSLRKKQRIIGVLANVTVRDKTKVAGTLHVP
jgi:hypothetical protein